MAQQIKCIVIINCLIPEFVTHGHCIFGQFIKEVIKRLIYVGAVSHARKLICSHSPYHNYHQHIDQ